MRTWEVSTATTKTAQLLLPYNTRYVCIIQHGVTMTTWCHTHPVLPVSREGKSTPPFHIKAVSLKLTGYELPAMTLNMMGKPSPPFLIKQVTRRLSLKPWVTYSKCYGLWPKIYITSIAHVHIKPSCHSNSVSICLNRLFLFTLNASLPVWKPHFLVVYLLLVARFITVRVCMGFSRFWSEIALMLYIDGNADMWKCTQIAKWWTWHK